jgi:hypothetical protein
VTHAFAFSSQYVIPIWRYIVIAVVMCSLAFSLVRAVVDLAEAEVAVGGERAHADPLRRDHRVGRSPLDR